MSVPSELPGQKKCTFADRAGKASRASTYQVAYETVGHLISIRAGRASRASRAGQAGQRAGRTGRAGRAGLI